MRKEKRLQTSRRKKLKIIKALIILIVGLICILSFFFMRPQSKKDTPKKDTLTSTLSSSEAQEGKKIREAMNGIVDLYEDTSNKILREDLNISDIKKVKKSVDKLEEGNLKKELNKRLDEIKSKLENSN